MALTIKQFGKRSVHKLNRQQLEAAAHMKGGAKLDTTNMNRADLVAYVTCGELPIGNKAGGLEVPSHGRRSARGCV